MFNLVFVIAIIFSLVKFIFIKISRARWRRGRSKLREGRAGGRLP